MSNSSMVPIVSYEIKGNLLIPPQGSIDIPETCMRISHRVLNCSSEFNPQMI